MLGLGLGANKFINSARVKYGPELITNGGFDTDTTWTKESDWTISGGVASADGVASNAIYQDATGFLVDEKWYKVEVTVSNYTQGTLTISVSLDANEEPTITADGTYSFIVKSGPTVSQFRFDSPDNFIGDIDNVSCKELISGLSPELIINGEFDADTDWTKEAGWTIASGVASAAAVTGGLYQDSTLMGTIGKTYLISFTISNYVSGTMFATAGAFSTSPIVGDGNGFFSGFQVSTIDNQWRLEGDSAFTGDIDNFSIKEVI